PDPGERRPRLARHPPLGVGAREHVRLRESRSRSEGSPQGASAEPPMRNPAAADKLAPQRPELTEKRDEGRDGRSFQMRKVLEIGGMVAAVVLIAFGIGSVGLGMGGEGAGRAS